MVLITDPETNVLNNLHHLLVVVDMSYAGGRENAQTTRNVVTLNNTIFFFTIEPDESTGYCTCHQSGSLLSITITLSPTLKK